MNSSPPFPMGGQLLVRAKANRTLADRSKLLGCLAGTPSLGSYTVAVPARNGRKSRTAQMQRYFPRLGD